VTVPWGVTHYAWPGGLAVKLVGPDAGLSAAFADGWRVEPVQDGREAEAAAPPGADVVHLALPADVASQCAALEFVGAALHTDFVSLSRFVEHLQGEGVSAVLLVVGPHPAAVVIDRGAVTALDPARPDASEADVLKRASGWIVHLAGRLRNVPATAAGPPTARTGASAPTPEAAGDAPTAEAAGVPGAAALPTASVDPVGTTTGTTFGRFPPDARFLMAPGARRALPADVTARIAAVTGRDAETVLALLDGTRTLDEVAAAAGLAAAQVAEVVEVLVARRLAFRYLTRPRSASRSR
jgi:hypothetical protein